MDKLPGGQWCGGPVRAPNMPLTDEERQAVENEFRHASSPQWKNLPHPDETSQEIRLQRTAMQNIKNVHDFCGYCVQ